VDAHPGLLRITLAPDQLDDARTLSRSALFLAPAVALPWTTAGLVEEASGNVEGALKTLEKGTQLGGQVVMAQFNRGRVLAQVGRFVEAVTPLSQATALESNNADAWSVLGLVLKALGQHKEAIDALEKAKDLAPNDPEVGAISSTRCSTCASSPPRAPSPTEGRRPCCRRCQPAMPCAPRSRSSRRTSPARSTRSGRAGPLSARTPRGASITGSVETGATSLHHDNIPFGRGRTRAWGARACAP